MRKVLILVMSIVLMIFSVTAAYAEQIARTELTNNEGAYNIEAAFVQSYQVETGDSLTRIARRYNTNWQLIAAMNDINNPNTIFVGQQLDIPIVQQDQIVVHPGDTLWDIAERFEVSVGELAFENGITEPRQLFVGQRLSVPNMPVIPTFMVRDDAVPTLSRGILEPYFSWPILGTLTSLFGPRGTGYHHGIDIAADSGDLVRASAEGQVVFSGWKSDIYGYTVVIDHGRKYQTLYAHNQTNLVKKGDEVAAGDDIAAAGSTGRTTGSHVHFEIYRNGDPVNPLQLLP